MEKDNIEKQVIIMSKDIEYIKQTLDAINQKLERRDIKIEELESEIQKVKDWQTGVSSVIGLIKWAVGALGLGNVLVIIYLAMRFLSNQGI